MCLIVFSYQQHPSYPFILVANRDEFYHRPTASMQYWHENLDILAGQDLAQMGSWLGLNKNGCFSAVTNFRKLPDAQQYPLSRGKLIIDSLTHSADLTHYLQRLEQQQSDYGPYNLLSADDSGLYYSNNHDHTHYTKLSPGLYGLCNASLDSPWPKLEQAKQQLGETLQSSQLTIKDLRALLNNSTTAAAANLPNTGLSPEWEQALSAQFINLEDYGTRAKTIILQRQDGLTQICEITYQQGNAVAEQSFELQLPIIGGS